MSQQLNALGASFPAHPEILDFVEKMREKYDVCLPEDKKEKKKYIKKWTFKIWSEVQAECLKHIKTIEDFKESRVLLEVWPEDIDKEAIASVINQVLPVSKKGNDLYFEYEIELAKNLAHFILTDEWLPFPESLTGQIIKMRDEDGIVWFLSAFGPLTDMKTFTKKQIKLHNKNFKQPKFGAKEYVRNAIYFRQYKMGMKIMDIALLEVMPKLKKLKIKEDSDEFYELLEKTKEKIRIAILRFQQQLRIQVYS